MSQNVNWDRPPPLLISLPSAHTWLLVGLLGVFGSLAGVRSSRSSAICNPQRASFSFWSGPFNRPAGGGQNEKEDLIVFVMSCVGIEPKPAERRV